jgi:hypothetical protein
VANSFGVLPTSPVNGGLSATALSFYQIPLFLLPIYQAAGIQYGVPWQILAAINEVETDYGRDLAVSSAGALGWMQFLEPTWLQYGVDANNSGVADPYNPADAIFAAARYLSAAGVQKNLRSAIFAYNHSESYVDSVLLRAELIATYPQDLIASLTGMAQGQLPADGAQITGYESAPAPSATMTPAQLRAALLDPLTGQQPAVTLQAPRTSQVVAVQDGRITAIGHSRWLGDYIRLTDVYGNTYTYADLGRLARHYRAPAVFAASAQTGLGASAPLSGPTPSGPASAGSQPASSGAAPPAVDTLSSGQVLPTSKQRLYAHPNNTLAQRVLDGELPAAGSPRSLRLQVGSVVLAGTVLGTLSGDPASVDGQMRFAIAPAGDPDDVDPRPILENWRLLHNTLDPQGGDATVGLVGASAGEVFLENKASLAEQVLTDPRVSIYSCGREDIEAGLIDRRVLAVIEYLARVNLEPTISGLRCGQPLKAPGGVASSASQGDSVVISAINGTAVAGHQGRGSVTDRAIRALLTLQGPFEPDEIISKHRYPAASNTFGSKGADFLRVVFLPDTSSLAPTPKRAARRASAASTTNSSLTDAALDPSQWARLMTRIDALPEPAVVTQPSSSAIADRSSGLLRSAPLSAPH